ncbi:primosomal protein N' [bacterium]|nr:primosomal protein N' [bacterium]
MTPRLVSVALNRPMREPYAYEVPPELAPDMEVGALVEVPLASKTEIGCVVQLDPPLDPAAMFKLRPVARRVSGAFVLDSEIIGLCRWLSDYYLCGLGEALATASMIGFSDTEARARISWQVDEHWSGGKLTPRQREAADHLQDHRSEEFDSVAAIAEAGHCSAAVAKKLTEVGFLRAKETMPEDFAVPLPPPDSKPILADEQQVAVDAVTILIREGRFGVSLLHGITGSGKTEVYLRLIEEAFAHGRTALCLVPEIALTPQTVDRFARRFQEEIGVFHSQMTRLEKRILWEKIRAGRVRLVIGARSAAFAPLPNLGIVIVDEEHESSYKQGESPRYHARDLLVVRASRLSIPVVLGSATPSLESYDNAVKGKYALLRLATRPTGLQLPEVKIVSLGREAIQNPEAGFTLFSEELLAGIRERLARGEQSIVFLNRRGFSNFLMCSNCRWVARCNDDDIVLTIHRRGRGKKNEDLELELFPGPLERNDATLRCHFCGTYHDYPEKCPECGEDGLVALGAGTQRIEEALARHFPDAKILRLDQDTVGGRQAWLKAWQEMVSGEAQIILGTQMIAKGLHLERVTLVGVILADVGLYIPDFRAEERVFSLLMQVAGRAGRKDMGEVLLQTYMPRHAGIQMAAKHDYEGFFRFEMEKRRKLRFPPVERLAALTISDSDRARAIHAARTLATILRRRVNQVDAPRPVVLGPQPAPVERLAGRFRQRVLLRCATHRPIAALLSRSLADEQWRPGATTRLSVDIDPQDML